MEIPPAGDSGFLNKVFNLKNLTIIENNLIPAIHSDVFAEKYFALRQQEGRVYTDEEVSTLPFIHQTHRYYKEWVVRKHSYRALLSYIRQKDFSNILEVGCGNGWLAAHLAIDTGSEVTGLDINSIELEQAKRVFFSIPRLNFIEGSLDSGCLRDKKFDLIIFPGSLHYFPSVEQTIHIALEYLTLLGEVHIMDSPFYEQHEIEAAKQRAKKYFNFLGFTDMAGYFYYHTISELDVFQYKILNHPLSWKNKLSFTKHPFYWITIKNRYR